jgi:hypothetical protein
VYIYSNIAQVTAIEPKAKEICAVAIPLLYTAENYSLDKSAYFSKISYDTSLQELLVIGANVPPASRVQASITQLLLVTEN